MPKYDDRKHYAAMARHDADEVMRRYGITPRSAPHIRMLQEIADRYDSAAERDYDRTRNELGTDYTYGEYRYREHPGRYNPQDYPRSEYENPHGDYNDPYNARGRGRRRDSHGRFMELDGTPAYATHDGGMYAANPSYDGGEEPRMAYYPWWQRPYMPVTPMMADGATTGHTQKQMGFSAGQSDYKGLGAEIDHYFKEWRSKQREYEQTQDPMKKQHAMTELKELSEYMEDLFEKISSQAKTPEEKQIITQMKHELSK